MRQNIFLLSLSLILLTFTGCIDLPDDLIMPEWDVNLNIPLINRVYTVDDVIQNQDYFSIDPARDSLYLISSDKYQQGRAIVDFIKLEQEVISKNNIISPVAATHEIYLDYRNDNVRVDSAVFEKGYIKLSASNNSDVYSTISFVLPGICNSSGEAFHVSLNLEPRQHLTTKAQLNGYKLFMPESQVGINHDKLWVIASTQFASAPRLGEHILFDVEISEFSFKSVTGTFPLFNLSRSTTEFPIAVGNDIIDFRDKIILKEAELLLSSVYESSAANSFDLMIDSLNITAKRGDEVLFLKDSTGSKEINILIQNNISNVLFCGDNSNIEEFFSFLPDIIELSASYKVQGNNNRGTISKADSIKFSAAFKTTSKFALSKTDIIDTVEIRLSLKDREQILNAASAELIIDVENAIPLNSSLKIILLDENHKELTTASGNAAEEYLSLGMGVVDNSGRLSDTYKNIETVILNSEEVQSLSRAYYAVISLSIMSSHSEGSSPVTVEVHANDWIKLKIYGNVKYRMNTADN